MARKGDPRISKMWRVAWRDGGGRERYRVVPSCSEALSLVRKEAARGGVALGDPVELDDRWLCRWRDARGRSRKRTFRTQTEAKAFLLQEDTKRARGEWHDPRGGRRVFSEWAAEVAATRADRRASTLARDESVLRSLVLPTFGSHRLDEISDVAIQGWVASLSARGLDPWTVRKAYQLLATTMARAVRARLIARNPCEGIELPRIEYDREQRFLSPAEIRRLADEIDPRYRTLVLVAAYTGCRFGELAALRVERIDFLRRQIRVEETLNEVRGHLVISPCKTRRSRRTIALPGFLLQFLATEVAAKGPSDFVFKAPGGGPLRRNAFRQRTWLPAVRRAGLEPLRFHDLRHSHAAMLISQGVHPKAIADRLGHASIRTTMDTYGHLLEGLDASAADALEATYRSAVYDTGAVIQLATE